MGYNELEYFAFLGLILVPGVVPVVTGIRAHQRPSAAWVPRYLILGILGSFIYAAFAGGLLGKMVLPPYVSGLSEGRGLDLRGVSLVVGSWIGGPAGVVLRSADRRGVIDRAVAAERPRLSLGLTASPRDSTSVHWPFPLHMHKDDSRSRRDSKSKGKRNESVFTRLRTASVRTRRQGGRGGRA